jgi:hypothetical protein
MNLFSQIKKPLYILIRLSITVCLLVFIKTYKIDFDEIDAIQILYNNR